MSAITDLAAYRAANPHPGITVSAPLTEVEFPPEAFCANDTLPGPGGLIGDMDTVHAIASFRTFLASGYSPKTQAMYTRTVMRFFCDTLVPITEVTESDLATWLEGFPYRSSSRRTHFNALLALFSWAQRNGLRSDNPISGIRVPAPVEKAPRALSVEQYQQVRAAAYRRHPMRAAAIDLLYFTGGRIHEVLELTWADVSDDGVVFRTTKTGHERKIPMSDGLRRALLVLHQWFGEHARVLPRSQQTVWSWVNTAGNEAGVPDVHPHLFRSSMATTMLRGGARPHAVRQMLGHAKIQTTTRYWSVEDADVEDAVKVLDEAQRWQSPLPREGARVFEVGTA